MNARKYGFRISAVLVAVLVILCGLLMAKPAFAEDIPSQEVLTSFTVDVPDDGAEARHQYSVSATFALPDDDPRVNPGDTTTIPLPDELKFADGSTTLELKDGDEAAGTVELVSDESGKRIVITYGAYVETHNNITGGFTFSIEVDFEKYQEPTTIEWKVPISTNDQWAVSFDYNGVGQATQYTIQKMGWNVNDDNVIMYKIQVNTNNSLADGTVTIVDTPSAGVLISDVSAKKGTWDDGSHGEFQLQDAVDAAGDVTIADGENNSKVITIEASQGMGYEIYYRATPDDEVLGGVFEHLDTYTNKAELNQSDTIVAEYVREVTYQGSSGYIGGDTYSIELQKLDEGGNALPGAAFDVYKGENKKGTITVGEDGKGTLEELLKGTYTLKETTVPEGYKKADDLTVVISDDTTDDQHVVKVSVPNTPEETEVEITKTWEDNDDADGKRPAADDFKSMVYLYADGTKVENVTPTVTDNGDNTYTVTWSNLPAAKGGQVIVYTVIEDAIEGYTPSTTEPIAADGSLTNTHEAETIDIPVTKIWDDNDNQDGARPAVIAFTLYADGSISDRKTLTGDESWNWTFTGLPKYRDHGTEIDYEVIEDTVADYTTSYDGNTVINTHTPGKTSVTVLKTWNDADNKDGLRPEKVTVKLLADGKDTGKSLELTKANGWKGTFTDLDAMRAGKDIAYTIQEVEVKGYTATLSGDAKSGFTLTNTHNPEDNTRKPQNDTRKSEESGKKLPQTGDPAQLGMAALLASVGASSVVSARVMKSKKKED